MTLNQALNSEVVKEFVKDDKKAQALYAAFCNRDWFPVETVIKPGMEGDGFSWRGAGGMVADLRNKGEDYMDFYCSGCGDEGVPEGTITTEVEELMAGLGWKSIPL